MGMLMSASCGESGAAQIVLSRLFDVHVDDFSKRIHPEKRKLDVVLCS
jgi:hypothetical protein